MDKIIICIIGGTRCGKDTASRIFYNKLTVLGHTTNIYSFADKLKQITSLLFNIELETIDKMKNNKEKLIIKNNKIEMRDILKKVAESTLDLMGKQYFVNTIIKKIEDEQKTVSIITDMRFKNEYEEIQKLQDKYKIYYIKLNSNLKDCFYENELDDIKIDFIINNRENSLILLKDNIKNVIRKIV